MRFQCYSISDGDATSRVVNQTLTLQSFGRFADALSSHPHVFCNQLMRETQIHAHHAIQIQ